MSKVLLLISKDEEDKVFAQHVAAQSGLTVSHVSDPIQGAQTIANSDVAVTFVDVSTKQDYVSFEKTLQDTAGLFSQKVNPTFIHFLSTHDLADVSHLIQSPLFGNFICKNYGGKPQELGTHYGRLVQVTLKEDAFGLNKIMDPKVKVQIIKLQSSEQKSDAVEAIRRYLIKAQFQSRISSIISTAVDELLLNGIFDAPVDDVGKPIHTMLPRSTKLPLEGRAQIEMQVAFDGKYIAVTVADQWGSLLKNKLLSHISKIYVSEEYKLKTTVAGAGIGLATTYHSGGSIFFHCAAGSKTEVTVFFRKTPSFKEFRSQFRFISTKFVL